MNGILQMHLSSFHNVMIRAVKHILEIHVYSLIRVLRVYLIMLFCRVTISDYNVCLIMRSNWSQTELVSLQSFFLFPTQKLTDNARLTSE